MLRSDAELWYDINQGRFETWDMFKQLFLTYYFGEQAKIKENLYFGKYNENYHNTRENYAMKKYALATNLEPAILPRDIIKYLARHFEDEIANVIAIQDIDSIDRLLQYLRRIDDIKKTKRGPTKQVNYYGREDGRTGGSSVQRRSGFNGSEALLLVTLQGKTVPEQTVHMTTTDETIEDLKMQDKKTIIKEEKKIHIEESLAIGGPKKKTKMTGRTRTDSTKM